MWWMRVTYELHCPITVESSANLYSPNNPISANSCTIIQRVRLPFVIASMRGGHGDSCRWRSESSLTLTLVLNKRLFVDFFGRRCFFRGLKYLNNLQWKSEATGSCCTSGHNVALGFNLLVPPGELLGKSTPECAGHVENLHAVKWTGLDWTNARVLVHLHPVPITFTAFWKSCIAGTRASCCWGEASQKKRPCGAGGQGGLAVREEHVGERPVCSVQLMIQNMGSKCTSHYKE